MKIKIHNYTFSILEADEKDSYFYNKETDTVNCFGCFNAVRQEIQIWKYTTLEKKKTTLIHELTHAFLFVYHAPLQHDNRLIEEDVCHFMQTHAEDILKIVEKYFGQKKKD